MKFLKTLLLFSFINYSIQVGQINYIEEIPNYLSFFLRFFIIFPIFERLSVYFSRYSLLPDDLVHYDFYGNFIGNTRDSLENDEICENMLNYTETFKRLSYHLYKGKGGGDLMKDGWTDQEEIFIYPKSNDPFLFEFDKIEPDESFNKKNIPYFKNDQYEESSEKWESIRGAYFSSPDSFVSIKEMSKTFSTFRYIDVPLRRRFAIVLESYLVDLSKLFYPFLAYSALTRFEDLLALILFYLYVKVDNDNLAINCAIEIINDLKRMGTILKLPKEDEMMNRIDCLKMLLDDVLKFDLYFTFNLLLNSKMFNLNSSTLIKKIIGSKNERFIKLFLKEVDRNVKVDGIGEGYDGYLCHVVYWSKLPWLFQELLKYEDVDWNVPDSKGYTVLGILVNDHNPDDQLYKLFLQSTRHFNICYKAEGLERNILEECLIIDAFHISMSRFMTFLDKRRRSDDFGVLLISAALHNRPDYFDLILLHRRFNCSHELDSAFQSLLQLMGMDEPFLYQFLLRILVWGREWHGCKGNKLEHIFFLKWEIQLERWSVAFDKMGLKYN